MTRPLFIKSNGECILHSRISSMRALFQQGAHVWYHQRTPRDKLVAAHIKKVHYEDNEPYYTVQIEGQKHERQTTAQRLRCKTAKRRHLSRKSYSRRRTRLKCPLLSSSQSYNVRSSAIKAPTFSPSASSFTSPCFKSTRSLIDSKER